VEETHPKTQLMFLSTSHIYHFQYITTNLVGLNL